MPERDLLHILCGRTSCPRLQEPGPTPDQLDALMRAALRAPDHAALRPWRFLVIEGDARQRLGELFLDARLQSGSVTENERERLLAMPLRAPTLIVALARIVAHPKVPDIEQFLSVGAAVQNILVAVHALGLGAMWRTGDLAYHDHVREGLGLESNESIVGFVYLGTPAGPERQPPALDPETYFSHWR